VYGYEFLDDAAAQTALDYYSRWSYKFISV